MARKLVPEQHESKRREILAAAHRCFLRHGLQGASVAVICNEAGISPGHLYHYFPSKEAIVEQMADDYLAGLHAHFARHTQGEPVATVLLSELWSMEGWDDLAHCRILFELLAEGGCGSVLQAASRWGWAAARRWPRATASTSMRHRWKPCSDNVSGATAVQSCRPWRFVSGG